VDFLKNYSIQHWLESAPQGYLEGTQYGHPPDEQEPAYLLENEAMLERTISSTVQLVVGERAALAASSGLVNSAPDAASKCFLATQTLDEARHVEVFTRRLFDLGVKPAELESVIAEHANPHLVEFAAVLLEKVDKKDFVAGVVGQNIILEGMAFSVFELMHAVSKRLNPKFAHTLAGTIADERRHVGFGENRIGTLIREHPEKLPEIGRMQREMSYLMLATFADRFRDPGARVEMGPSQPGDDAAQWQGVRVRALDPRDREQLLADAVLKEFKLRLGRLGIEYQEPARP
jgi:hypothetical protein